MTSAKVGYYDLVSRSKALCTFYQPVNGQMNEKMYKQMYLYSMGTYVSVMKGFSKNLIKSISKLSF